MRCSRMKDWTASNPIAMPSPFAFRSGRTLFLPMLVMSRLAAAAAAATTVVDAGLLTVAQPSELLLELLELLLAALLQVHQQVARALRALDQLIELEVNGPRVTILRVLDQKHHQKRD